MGDVRNGWGLIGRESRRGAYGEEAKKYSEETKRFSGQYTSISYSKPHFDLEILDALPNYQW